MRFSVKWISSFSKFKKDLNERLAISQNKDLQGKPYELNEV